MAITNKDTYLAPLLNSETALLNIVADVDNKLFTFKSAPEKWSIAEVIEHVVIVETAIISNLKQLGLAKSQAKPDTLFSNDKVMELSSNHQLKSKTLELFAPKGIFEDKQTAISAFKQSREKVTQFIQTCELELASIFFPHPRIGVLSGENWLIFITGHCLKHVPQIEEIKRQYDKNKIKRMSTYPSKAKELRSLVSKDGTLSLSIQELPVPQPKDHEIVVRIEASPINPSDVAVIIGFPSLGNTTIFGTNSQPKNPIQIPEQLLPAYSGRLDKAMPAGNEGAGVVVAAGKEAQHMIGRVVALFGMSSFAQYRVVPAQSVLLMNEGTTPLEAAASCVNPFTVLSMIETMKMEGHTAMINTAAASNLGQMLIKACKDDGIPLVNVVRREEQVTLLKSIGAEYVCNSSSPDFKKELVAAIAETGATLAFECIGGGDMTNNLLVAMEQALLQKATSYSRYGSTTHKQVYIYGGLSQQPTPLNRSYGMAWGVGGWLVTPIIQKVGPEGFQKMKQRIADEIHTTFKSTLYKEISLEEALQPDNICAYAKAASGEKYYVNPML